MFPEALLDPKQAALQHATAARSAGPCRPSIDGVDPRGVRRAHQRARRSGREWRRPKVGQKFRKSLGAQCFRSSKMTMLALQQNRRKYIASYLINYILSHCSSFAVSTKHIWQLTSGRRSRTYFFHRVPTSLGRNWLSRASQNDHGKPRFGLPWRSQFIGPWTGHP